MVCRLFSPALIDVKFDLLHMFVMEVDKDCEGAWTVGGKD